MADGNDLALGYAMGQDSNGGNCNNGGMWGDGGWWAIILFAMIFGWGNGGWGGGFGGGNGAGLNGALTRADLCQDMNFQGVENGIRGVQQGLCDGFYAMNTSLLNGFNGVDNAVCNLGYTVQQGFNATQVAMMQGQNALQAQLAQCCCDNRAGQADIKYQMATDTCAIQNTIQNTTRDILDNNNANTRAVLDFLVQDKISSLQAENQNLKLAASQANQNAAIGAMISASEATILRRTGAECPTAAYVVQPPTPVNFPTNCCGQFTGWGNNGCGCNGGCGC